MKLDLLNKQWLDIVFEGRNKSYGAYDLRQSNQKTSGVALLIGAVVFALAVSTPKIIEFIGNSTTNDDATLNTKITTVKMPPKEKPKENLTPPPPPPPKVDQIKFVKPVVAKTEEVVEEIVQVKQIEDKKLGAETIKGDPDAELTLGPSGDGPKNQEITEDNTVYNSAGVQVEPSFPGGIDKFRQFIANNFDKDIIEDENFPGGKIFATFTVEKDGSLSDIKVKDIGYGTGKETERVLRKAPRWTPAEQNGKKVRCTYVIPIAFPKASE
ncbi:energy transducer TonB [Flavobacterium aciduliphilum]|uniref:Protein TonB n=1 Tax=Flavobacterium aciduliphilum TaxID=1101402 RepID=A0A328YVS6_9FLAO|nr:energy transducer TonB [Flavobacterium aciduliphilum]RAR74186.1 protein TonB [Flavobacterium aciduliphilum]